MHVRPSAVFTPRLTFERWRVTGLRGDFCHRHPNGEFVRSLVLSLFLVLPGSGLTALIHFAAVPHAVCVEHGDFIHLPPDWPAVGSALQRDDGTYAAVGAFVPANHAHCGLSVSLRQEFDDSHSSEVALSVAEPLSAPVRWLGPPSRIAVFRVAPKQSPPFIA